MSSKIKNFKCYKNLQITVADFIYQMYGITGDKIRNLTHKELMNLFPKLRRVSFEVANDNNLLYIGNIILVRDRTGIVLPYVRNFSEETFTELKIESNQKQEKLEEQNCSELTNYELIQYKRKTSNPKKSRLILQEMKMRNLQNSGIRKRKIEDIRKKDYYEEY